MRACFQFHREWPSKIYTVSYALYPLIGVLVTVIVACIISLITGKVLLTYHNLF